MATELAGASDDFGMRVVATAGHVDHGKSTLVHALTGIEPDRLAEEQRRGLTIDLGFAWTQMPRAGWVAFVDVPGHIAFIKNMLAGVAVVQSCVLAVDAREGWRAQTEEHLRILEFAGLDHGMTVITKRSLVDDDRMAEVRDEVKARLSGSFLEQQLVVFCDAMSGDGIGEVRAALDAELATLSPPVDRGRPRVWIDRAFTIRGAGTVVTGGLAHGSLRCGDRLELVGARRRTPEEVRIRNLESLGQKRVGLCPGSRAAVNLPDLDVSVVARGDALVRGGEWQLSNTVDVSLEVLKTLAHPVTARGAFLVYVGSGEHNVKLGLIGKRSRVEPGASVFARLRFERALPLVPGDRFVLREAGRAETIGGGEILDVAPIMPMSRAQPDRSVERIISERGWVALGELERLSGQVTSATVGQWAVSSAALKAERAALLALLEKRRAGVDMATLDERQRAIAYSLQDEGAVELQAGFAALPGLVTTLRAHPYFQALDTKPFAPPSPAEFGVDEHALEALRRVGLIVRQDGHYFSATAISRAAAVLEALLEDHPEGVTVTEVKQALGTTRKWALPLLACLDEDGTTRRVGDRRVAGHAAGSTRRAEPTSVSDGGV